jgi:NAD(P)-dependent dehydrogenase (short-subunit alcohol dehydrogenase family)
MAVAVITGGASLIGSGIAQCLVEKGWQVVLTEIPPSLDGAKKVAADLGGAAKASIETLDVTDPDAANKCFERIAAEKGSVDALVNVAGGLRGLGVENSPFLDTTPEQWDHVIGVNLKGVFNCCQAAIPHMIKAGKGGIVSIAANRGLKGGKDASLYSTAKAGVIVFTQAMAQELGPHKIRINSVDPGSCEARWKVGHYLKEARVPPLGRFTTGRDVGKVVAFLLSDRASHITGAMMDVSGGSTMH